MSVWNFFRFLAIAGCFLVSLLVILPAANLALFQLKLAATEYGHWVALFVVAIMAAGRRTTGADTAGLATGAVAAVLLMSSSVRAAMLAPALKRELPAAFAAGAPAAKNRRAAFSFIRLWSWKKPEPIEPQTLSFASHAAEALELDFYPTHARSPAPCVIVLHTGGWNNGKRDEFPAMNHHLAARGYAVAAIDYRLAPRWTWPAQRDDTRAAIHFLTDRAGEYGIDPKKFVLLGRSAGAQIAEATTASGLEPGIRGCIAFYGPADLRFAFKYADPGDILNSDKLLREYLGGTPDDVPRNYDSATANGQVTARTPPMLLLHGVPDELVWVKQSERLAERLTEAGAPHYFLRLPWATHAFDYNFNGPAGQISTWAVDEFLDRITED